MQLCCHFVVLALATLADASVLRGKAESLSLQLQLQEQELESGDLAILEQAEAEDRAFLLSQLDATESQLLKIQELATPAPAAKAPEAKAAAKPAEKELDPVKMAASLGVPNLPNLGAIKGLKGQMALAPMLAMLKGLYDDSKDRIAQQNTREEKSKKWFTQKEAEHKAKLATIDGKFANHTLSEEFHTNETRDEMRYFNYWQRCRERQHRQFHTNLKIQHAMMSKVKKMIDMYEHALSSKPSDQQAAKKALGQMTGMPEIVFLQQSVTGFLQESLAEVQKEREQLQADSEAAKAGMTY